MRRSLPATLPAVGLGEDIALSRVGLLALDALAGLLADPRGGRAAWAPTKTDGLATAILEAAGKLAGEHARLAGTLQGHWRDEASQLNLSELLAEWRSADEKRMLVRHSRKKAVRAKLASAVDGEVPEDPSADLETLIAMGDKEKQLMACAAPLAVRLGTRWQGVRSDFVELRADLRLCQDLRAASAAGAPEPAALLRMRDYLRHLVGEGADLLAASGTAGLVLGEFRQHWAESCTQIEALTQLCGSENACAVAEIEPGWELGRQRVEAASVVPPGRPSCRRAPG